VAAVSTEWRRIGGDRLGEWKRGDYDQCDRLQAACNDWLNEKNPEWQNPLACW
jgi:hypothetical protein